MHCGYNKWASPLKGVTSYKREGDSSIVNDLVYSSIR